MHRHESFNELYERMYGTAKQGVNGRMGQSTKLESTGGQVEGSASSESERDPNPSLTVDTPAPAVNEDGEWIVVCLDEDYPAGGFTNWEVKRFKHYPDALRLYARLKEKGLEVLLALIYNA